MKSESEELLTGLLACYEIHRVANTADMQVHTASLEDCERCKISLYHALDPLARRTLFRRGHRVTRAEAEELQHEVYVRLTDNNCQRLTKYHPAKGAFEAWLAALVDHYVVDCHRKNHAEEILDEINADVQSRDPGPEAEYLEAERTATFRRVIAEVLECNCRFLDALCDDTVTGADLAKAMGWKPKDSRANKLIISSCGAEGSYNSNRHGIERA